MPLAAIVAAVEALLGLLGLLRSAKNSALPACHELGSATATDADAQALDAIRAALRDVPDLGERVNEGIIAHPALWDVRAALGRSSPTQLPVPEGLVWPAALDDTQRHATPDDASGDGEPAS